MLDAYMMWGGGNCYLDSSEFHDGVGHMRLSDYLIDQAGKDWTEMLRPWCPPLPASFTVWMVNRFGDVFAVFDDGSVNLLDVGQGTLTRIAEDRDDCATRMDLNGNVDQWLMVSLVDRCVAAGLALDREQCYGYTTPPIFSEGKYEIENLFAINLKEHYSVLADIHRQIKDLPDRSQVEIVVVNDPRNNSDQAGARKNLLSRVI